MVKRIKANGRNGKKKNGNGHASIDDKIASGIGRAMANALAATVRPRGHQSQYKPVYAQQAKKACEAAFTDMELADLFGVSFVTINNWKLAHPDFALALKTGKDPADNRVERSFFQKATGFWIDTEKVFQYEGEIIRAPVREYYPPDTAAAFIWLKNRRPDKWRDKHEIEHSGKMEHRFTLEIFERDVGMKVIEGNAAEKKSIPRLSSRD